MSSPKHFIYNRDELFRGKDEMDTFGDNGILNRFDFGLGTSVAAELGQIVVGLKYELGLTNIGKDNLSYKNRNAALTIGYKFKKIIYSEKKRLFQKYFYLFENLIFHNSFNRSNRKHRKKGAYSALDLPKNSQPMIRPMVLAITEL